jgi:hypothetical protein
LLYSVFGHLEEGRDEAVIVIVNFKSVSVSDDSSCTGLGKCIASVWTFVHASNSSVHSQYSSSKVRDDEFGGLGQFFAELKMSGVLST